MRSLVVVLILGLLMAPMAFGGDSVQVKTKAEVQKSEAQPDSTQNKEQVKMEKPEFITTESGLKYADLVVGTGKDAVNGMKVECHYTLWIADENDMPGKKLQSSKDMGRPFEFKVGGPLIKGWNEGMIGMREGGTRMLVIPPDLGYGQNPPPGSGIPKDKNLVFEIEFLKAK